MTQLERLEEVEATNRRLMKRLEELDRRQKAMEARLGDGELTAMQQVNVRDLAAEWHMDQLTGRRPRRRSGARR